jgi:class 3 adenylate cyclase
VLFCDLVGSTQIASHLDPEEWREIVANCHRAATQAIEHFSGSVAQYLADGVMAYFGYPEAHDSDAECAARGWRFSTPYPSSMSNLAAESSPRGSVSIQGRWWLVAAAARKPMYSRESRDYQTVKALASSKLAA